MLQRGVEGHGRGVRASHPVDSTLLLQRRSLLELVGPLLSQPVTVADCCCHSLSLSQTAAVTAYHCRRLLLSQSVTVADCCCHNLSLSQPVTVTACHCHIMSLSQPVSVTAWNCHSLSLSQPATLTTCHSCSL